MENNAFIICQEKAKIVCMIFNDFFPEPALAKSWTCCTRKGFLPLREKNAGQKQQLISSCQIQCISLLLDLRSIWMSNLKRSIDAISTATRLVAPERPLATNLRYYDFVSHYLFPIFCVILKQKAEDICALNNDNHEKFYNH